MNNGHHVILLKLLLIQIFQPAPFGFVRDDFKKKLIHQVFAENG
jgi:hypothetical protein